MKKIFFTIVVSLLFIIGIVSSHEIESMRTLDQVTEDIMEEQGVSNMDQIDCDEVSNLDFEDLGNAIMEKMAGNHELHEQMDVMMGGEGSESLEQMHIIMGKNWLSCGNGYGMMSGGMMPMMMNMMGNYYPGYYTNYNNVLIFGIIGWVLFILSLITIFVLFATGKLKIKKR